MSEAHLEFGSVQRKRGARQQPVRQVNMAATSRHTSRGPPEMPSAVRYNKRFRSKKESTQEALDEAAIHPGAIFSSVSFEAVKVLASMQSAATAAVGDEDCASAPNMLDAVSGREPRKRSASSSSSSSSAAAPEVSVISGDDDNGAPDTAAATGTASDTCTASPHKVAKPSPAAAVGGRDVASISGARGLGAVGHAAAASPRSTAPTVAAAAAAAPAAGTPSHAYGTQAWRGSSAGARVSSSRAFAQDLPAQAGARFGDASVQQLQQQQQHAAMAGHAALPDLQLTGTSPAQQQQQLRERLLAQTAGLSQQQLRQQFQQQHARTALAAPADNRFVLVPDAEQQQQQRQQQQWEQQQQHQDSPVRASTGGGRGVVGVTARGARTPKRYKEPVLQPAAATYGYTHGIITTNISLDGARAAPAGPGSGSAAAAAAAGAAAGVLGSAPAAFMNQAGYGRASSSKVAAVPPPPSPAAATTKIYDGSGMTAGMGGAHV